VIGAVGFSLVGLLVPRALGVGYDAIGDVLTNRMTLAAVAILAGAKLIAWWAALASGTSGGTLAPLLLISAGYGRLVGAVAVHFFPGLHVAPGAFAVVAMAAVFGASTRATFASIVFVFELTRDYDVLLPLMLASVLADLVAWALMDDSLMTEKLTRRGLNVGTEYEVDAFRTVPVAELMRAVDGAPALDPVRPTVSPSDAAIVALHLMVDEGLEQVGVTDEDGRVIGVCTAADLLAVRRRQMHHERRQPGWAGRVPVRLKRGWPNSRVSR
jgi:CBS domain-containing protein